VAIVQMFHSWGRWLVLTMLVVALIRFLIGLFQRQEFSRLSQTLMRVFSAVLGLQFLLGLGLLAFKAQEGLARQHFEHGAAMLTAVLLAEILPKRWRILDDGPRFRNHIILLLVIATLIVVGILRLPSEIQWRFLA